MKALITILILLTFLEASFLPLDLVLIIILLRAYLRTEKVNLYLALGFGMLVSFLNHHILGFESVLYIFLVQITHLLSRAPISRHILMVIPVMFVLLTISEIVLSLLFKFSIFWPKIALEAALAFPIYILIKFWEERFRVEKDIKLKV